MTCSQELSDQNVSVKVRNSILEQSPSRMVFTSIQRPAHLKTPKMHIYQIRAALIPLDLNRACSSRRKFPATEAPAWIHFLAFRLHTYKFWNVACYCQLLELLRQNFDLASDYSVNITEFSIFAHITPRDPGHLRLKLRLISKIQSDTFRQNGSQCRKMFTKNGTSLQKLSTSADKKYTYRGDSEVFCDDRPPPV